MDMRIFGSIISLITIAHAAMAQSAVKTLYRDTVFEHVKIEKDLSYVTTVPDGIKKKYYYFDLYRPDTTSAEKRPLVIWMHGGGFKFESKEAGGIQLWCNNFAKRGYICAAINYRSSSKNTLFNFRALVSACADAVEDAKRCVLYFKEHASQYQIDTNHIILAGNSAGGMIALQTVYSSPAELIGLSQDSSLNRENLNVGKISAVINFWGAIFDLNWLNNASVPIVSVHGKLDNTVPIDHKKSPFYGSASIHEKADSLNIPNRIKIYPQYAHELARKFNPLFFSKGTKKRWEEAGDFAAAFLYDELFSPGAEPVSR